ncbi:MAG TPA: hypothetical protein VGH28_12940 [Polyangiaceae bacterium]|jgi:hypothetical protein
MKMLWTLAIAASVACSSSPSGSDGGTDGGLDAPRDEGADSVPACTPVVILGSACSSGQVCAGPTIAKQCDGTTEQVTSNCSCESGGWTCSGITIVSCDAGAADAAGD